MPDLCSLRSLLSDLQKAEDDFTLKIGLTLGQASALCAIGHGYREMRQLSEQLGLTPSRMTRVIDSLEQKGLIVRDKIGDDRRVVTVSITEDGMRLIKESGDCHLDLPEDIANLLRERGKEKSWTKHT